MTPPPINERQMEVSVMGLGRAAGVTKQYAEACLEVGKKEGVEVLDIWTEMMKYIGWDTSQPGVPGSKELPENQALKALLSDGKLVPFEPRIRLLISPGLHFNDKGYKFLFDIFVAKIRATWPELEEVNGEEYDAVFPLWRSSLETLAADGTVTARAPRQIA